MKEIPFEVYFAKAVMRGKIKIGYTTMKKVEATMEKYPKLFKEEDRINNLPQAVHDNYRKEKKEIYNEVYEITESTKTGKGLFAWLKENPPVEYTTDLNVDIKEMFDKMWYDKIETNKKDKKYKKELNKLWDKYYK